MGPTSATALKHAVLLPTRKATLRRKRRASPTRLGSARTMNEAKSTSKRELAAFVQKEIKKGDKKQLAAVSKKCKNDSDSEDKSKNKDCFLLEELSKGIDGFNYDDMEKLSIHDTSTKGNDEVAQCLNGRRGCIHLLR
jgi:hypothetical protein